MSAAGKHSQPYPWEQRKLGEIADRILRKNKNNISNLPLTISAQSGLIAQNNFFDKQVASQNLSNYLLLYKGDFAYNKSYSNGYPYGAVKRLEKFNCGVVSSLYIAFKPTHVLPNFLAEYYETTKWYVEIYKRAAEGARNHGLLNISATDFFNSDISLPKRENEQEKIGQLFQSLDKTITLHEEQHRQLERLKKALLQKMFADETGYPALRFKGFTEKWEQRKLGEITDVRDGTHDSPHYVDEGYPLITSKNVSNGRINYDAVNYVSEYDFNQINKRSKVNINDILMGMIGTIGNLALIREDPNFAIKNVALIKYTESINHQFLFQNLQTSYISKELSNSMDGGTQKFISLKKIRNLSIKFPILNEQFKIGQLFQSLDKTITLHDKKIQYLKQLKRGLLQKMFV